MSLHCRMLWPKKETQCPNKNLGGGPQTIGSFNSGLVALVLTSGQHLPRRKCLVGIVTLRLLYYSPLFYPLQSAGESLEWQGSREKKPCHYSRETNSAQTFSRGYPLKNSAPQ